jgi:ribose/xylose/arabinose/galactoside ABC-type transport system permease subunit
LTSSETAESQVPTALTRVGAFNRTTLIFPALILLLGIVTSLFEPRFFSVENLLNLSRQLSPLMIISVGQTFAVIGGGLDLSLAAVLALCGVYGVLTMSHLGTAAGIAMMILCGAAFGIINGLIISWFRASPFIVTLGALSIARGLALTATGGLPIYDLPDRYVNTLGFGSVLGIPWPPIIALLTLIAGHVLLKYTVFGRHVVAIGSSEPAALYSGVNVGLTRTLIYGLSGVTAGIGAVVLTAWVSSAQPNAASGQELQSLAAVVLGGVALTGGVGSLLDAFWGVLILGTLSNSLDMIGISSFVQTLVTGVVIVLAAIVDGVRHKREY